MLPKRAFLTALINTSNTSNTSFGQFGQFGQYGHLVIWSSGPLVYSSSGHLVVFNIVKDCTILMEHNNE